MDATVRRTRDMGSHAGNTISSPESSSLGTISDLRHFVNVDATQLRDIVEHTFPLEDLPTELLVMIFNFLDGISQHVLRRVNARWNAILRSFPVVRYTTLVQLYAQPPPSTCWYDHISEVYSALASTETTNLVIRSVRNHLYHNICYHRLDKYWPNLRTLAICNGYFALSRYNDGDMRPQFGTHHATPFGLFVTPKMHWIVLKDADIEGLALERRGQMPHLHRSVEIVPTPNPYNGGKLFYFAKEADRPGVTLTVRHRFFPVSFTDSEQYFLDILDKECKPASPGERKELCDMIGSFNCPYFDVKLKSLLKYLQRFEPSFTNMNLDDALNRIAEWRHITFRCFVGCVRSEMMWHFPYKELFTRAFFCCETADFVFLKRGSKRAHNDPNPYERAIAKHRKLAEKELQD